MKRITPAKGGGPPQSISRRVTWAVTASAVSGGALAALVAMLTLDALVADLADERLRGATDTLLGELQEDRKGNRLEMARAVLDDENAEILTSGIRLAVYSKGQLLGGDPWAPPTPHSECRTFGAFGERVRACGKHFDDWLLVAASRTDRDNLRVRFGLAGALALLLGAGAAALLGRRLTRWAVDPLSELSRRLEQSDPTRHTELDVVGKLSNCLEVREIQLALKALIERIDVLLGQAQRFAADAAHELRTPLSTLRLRLELLEEKTPDAEARDEARALALRVHELAELLDRLLLLASPIEALRRGFVPVALEEVVADAISRLPEAMRNRIVVTQSDEGLVHGDPLLLRSLVTNAIDNALKFALGGAIELRLRTSSRVTLQVNDSGPGIPEALQNRVFEAFFRARPDATRGHGLGLALIGHIARAHGGAAQFRKVPQGASLEVTLDPFRAGAGPALRETRDEA